MEGTGVNPTMSSVVRLAIYLNGQWYYAYRGSCGVRSVTIDIDPVTGEYEIPGGVSFAPGEPIALLQNEFDDTTYDVNGDGRFNQGDVDELPQFLGSTTDRDLGLFDIDGDMAITMEDLSLFQAMIDSGLGAGQFGDGNGDCVPSCEELAYVAGVVDSELCDEPYRIEYDYDLDGDIGSDDLAQLMALARPRGDLDGDGIVGAGDNGIVLSAWGSDDPLADIDGSGAVGSEDLGFILATWGQTSCE